MSDGPAHDTNHWSPALECKKPNDCQHPYCECPREPGKTTVEEWSEAATDAIGDAQHLIHQENYLTAVHALVRAAAACHEAEAAKQRNRRSSMATEPQLETISPAAEIERLHGLLNACWEARYNADAIDALMQGAGLLGARATLRLFTGREKGQR